MKSPSLRVILVALGIRSIDAFDRSQHFGGVIHDLKDFRAYYDENGKLSTHLLLYPESCSSIINEHLIDPLASTKSGQNRFYNRRVHAITGDAEKAFFGTTDGGDFLDCNAVCVERGVDHSLIQHPMPHLYYKYKNSDGAITNENKQIDAWYVDNCEQVEYGFINYLTKEKNLNIMWVSPEGNRMLLFDLPYGEEHQRIIPTYIGHTLFIEDPDTQEVLLEHVVKYSGIRAIGKYEIPEEAKKEKQGTIDGLVKNHLKDEWERHKLVKRTFSANGFAVGRLPDDVFGTMGAYYYNNQHNIYMEEWNSRAQGIFVNWWETDVHFMNIPWRNKGIWQQRLLSLVEDWTNTKLEQTVMYGIRQYEPGARLLTHVDRINTHAASLIVNVAQGNISEPWRVEVHDHAGRLHEVTMQPGDIVYYESAKSLHGRNTPLKGGYYANLFTHYRPVGDPLWYEKENPEGTPEPLLDVGECRLVGSSDTYSQGSVQCDDRRIGPHLSPTMFAANSADDLFNWWKHTEPKTQ